jgi:hypothetical protein
MSTPFARRIARSYLRPEQLCLSLSPIIFLRLALDLAAFLVCCPLSR